MGTMTSQTKQYIELSDLVALRFECKNCKTAVLIPLGQAFDLNKLRDCPACGRDFISSSTSASIDQEIRTFVSAWAGLKRAFPPDGKFVSELALALEIKSPPSST